MKKHFALRIYNARKSWLGFLAFLVLLAGAMGLLLMGARSQLHAPMWLVLSELLGYVVGGGYGIFRLMKHLTVEEVVIDLDETAFYLTHLHTGFQQVIPWADMAAYRRHLYRDQDVLRIQTSTGQQLKVGVMELYTGKQNTSDMMEAFEEAVARRPWIQQRLLTFL